MSHSPQTTPERTADALLARTGLALAAAVVTNLVIWAIGNAIVDPIQVPGGDGNTDLEWPPVIVATAVGLVAAAVASYAVGRFGKRPRRLFLIVVAVATLLSLAGPLSADLDTDNKLALAAMHVVTGAAAVVALAPTLPERRRQ